LKRGGRRRKGVIQFPLTRRGGENISRVEGGYLLEEGKRKARDRPAKRRSKRALPVHGADGRGGGKGFPGRSKESIFYWRRSKEEEITTEGKK